ncbi:MAG: PIN domain-containing protein [Desulfurococcales archaeon]|nr:PIN domain-containing protein [Desulfurococcales archaeon]
MVDTNILIGLASGLITQYLIGEALETLYILGVPGSVVRELERLAESSPSLKTRKLARRALDILASNKLQHIVLETMDAGDVDDEILLTAVELKNKGYRIVVATNDKGLRKRLRSHGIPTLYYRETEGLMEVEWLPP